MRIEDLPLPIVIGTASSDDASQIIKLLTQTPRPLSFPITHAGMFSKDLPRLFVSHPYSNAIELYPPIATAEAFVRELRRLDRSKIRRERRGQADEHSRQAWEFSTADTGRGTTGIIVLPIWI